MECWAEAYESSQAPDQTCPCLIFETSTDNGATFTRHIVPTVNGSSSPEPFLAADPKVNGRFALTILDSTGTGESGLRQKDHSGARRGRDQRSSERVPRTLASSPGSHLARRATSDWSGGRSTPTACMTSGRLSVKLQATATQSSAHPSPCLAVSLRHIRRATPRETTSHGSSLMRATSMLDGRTRSNGPVSGVVWTHTPLDF